MSGKSNQPMSEDNTESFLNDLSPKEQQALKQLAEKRVGESTGRRDLLKTIGLGGAALATGSAGGFAAASEGIGSANAIDNANDSEGDVGTSTDPVDVYADAIPEFADEIATTTSELESAFTNLAAGDTIYISDANAPYRTSQWLDIDVDGVSVIGPGTSTLIKPANGANVGGIRVGHNAHCENITIQGIGYHGNTNNQDATVKRLHGIIVRDAQNVVVRGNYLTRTHPYHEHNTGGSGISVEHLARDVRVESNFMDDIGDRGIQVGGHRITVVGNIGINGFDRTVSANLQEPDGLYYAPKSVVIDSNIGKDNVQGSIVGVAPGTATGYSTAQQIVFSNNEGYGDHRRLVQVKPTAGDGTQNPVKYISIVGNVGRQGGGTATQPGIDAAGDYITIQGNTLVDYDGQGIYAGTNGTYVNISGNVVDSVVGNGIEVLGDYCTVSNNTVKSAGGHGILSQSAGGKVSGNLVRLSGDNGIRFNNVTVQQIMAFNAVGDSNQNASSSAEIHIDDYNATVVGNRVFARNGTYSFEENSTKNNVLYVANRADGATNAFAGLGAGSVLRANWPSFDVHNGVSDGDSDNSITITFDKPYDSRPHLSYGRQGGGITGVSYGTDANGNYTSATLSISTAGGTVDVNVNGTGPA